jgi:DNA-binding beta-propeller fold protein YncE
MILALFAAAVLQPQTVVTVDPSHRLIEGVASDGKTVWLSSLIDRQILACRKERCKTLATLPEGLHPFAIAWDSSRKYLWVAADCPPGVSFIKACGAGAVMAFDAKGKVRARIGPTVGDFHPGDVSAADGQVFASDSQNGMVYRLTPRGKALMAIVLPGVGKSGQGSAYDRANNRLIVADYSQGITAIDLATNTRTLLLRDNGKPLRGIDGLMRCGSGFLGVYNGQSPGQLIAFTIDGGKLKLREAVEGYTMPDPTQVASDGKRLLVVPNAGWEGAMKGETARSGGAPIIAFPLAAVCPS